METVVSLLPLLPFVFIAAVAYLNADKSIAFNIGVLVLATLIYGLVEFATSTEDLTILSTAGGFVGKIFIFFAVGGFVLCLTRAIGRSSE
jgi:hypothetical protein